MLIIALSNKENLKSILKKLSIESEYIENCLRLLNGIEIDFTSVNYYEDYRKLTIDGTIPNSEINISKITIDRNYGIYINLSIKDILINAKCSIYWPKVYYSVLCTNENNENMGIYYYNPSEFNEENNNFQECYLYYDSEVLKKLNNPYINYLVGYTQENFDNLGISQNKTIWRKYKSEIADNPECTNEEMAEIINNELISLNYDNIMEMLSVISNKADLVTNQVYYKKKYQ